MTNKLIYKNMRNINDVIMEKMYDTDNWLYIFVPTTHRKTLNWYLGSSVNSTKAEIDLSKYVKVKTKKNISDDDTLAKKAWKKKYPEEPVPSSFTVFMNSLGDPEVEKLMNRLLKMVDSGKINLGDFERECEKFKDVKLNENPREFKEILDNLD